MAPNLEILACLDPFTHYPSFWCLGSDVYEVLTVNGPDVKDREVILVKASNFSLITNERLLEEIRKLRDVPLRHMQEDYSVRIVNIYDSHGARLFPKDADVPER